MVNIDYASFKAERKEPLARGPLPRRGIVNSQKTPNSPAHDRIPLPSLFSPERQKRVDSGLAALHG
jgi:hypothetical protein